LLLLFSGRRFSYTPQNPADGEIWQYIEKLDHKGMELIEKMNLADFHSYLRSTDNTICGRYPISLLLAVCFEYHLLMYYICIFRQLIKLKRSFHQVDCQNFLCNLSNMLNQVK
jgi:predicted class III extradiol MEMO1 family dioxygenase